jgi:lysozyme family protein
MFDRALSDVLQHEGGFVDHPADRGGATNFGITQSVYDDYRRKSGTPLQSVKNISHPEVSQIYRDQYWTPSGAAQLASSDAWLAQFVFDYAVHSGVRTAVQSLQRLLGVKVDGVFGPITLRATLGHINNIKLRYIAQRYEFLADIVRRNPSQSVFILGWTRRLNAFLRALNDQDRD